MASIRKTSQAALESMVKGAANEVRTTGAGSKGSSSLPLELAERLLKQIDAKGRSIQSVPIHLIRLNENVRRRYDDEPLEALARSLDADGLIQMPTVCLKKVGKHYQLICRNGHRRILAAKKIPWKTIECIITSFDSAKAELYHVINANMSEDVFYLDLAHAYQEASSLGETDKEIAARVGLNPRTIGWYRRLAGMSPDCEALIREYPELFNATWAIKTARVGELPNSRLLYALMQKMVAEGRTWVPKPEESAESTPPPNEDKKKRLVAREKLASLFDGEQREERTDWARSFLYLLRDSGYLQSRSVKSIERNLWKDAP